MDVFDLFAKISLDTSEYEQAVKGASADGQQLAKSWSGFGQKISAAFSTLGKAAVAGAGAATAAVGVLTKSSLDAYSSFEQLTGGVETLFKESADTVMEYADNAYKTAGMSANQYMETITSFTGTLLRSLDGDTAAAAEYANMAITDMADNSNRMGVSLETLQQTYQSLARGNYEMLDSLNLGFAGTKAGLQEMLQAAEEYAAKNGQVRDFSVDSYADIVEAIHLVQQEMGITGTTAQEASSTIEGSVNSAKAAWENLVTGIADENADLGQLTDTFLSSAATAADNILPRIEQILQGMGTALESVAPAIAEQIPQIVSRVAPSMVSAGIQLFSSLVQGLVSAAPQLANAVPDIVQSVAGSFEQSASSMAAAGSSLLAMLQQGITEGIPMLANTAVSIMGEFGNYLQNNLSGLLDAGLSAVSSLSETIRQNAGLLVDGALGLAESLAQGLADSIPTIIENVPEIVTNIAGVINDNAPKVLVSAAKIIATLAEGLIDSIPTLIANIPEIITAIVDAFLAFNWLNLGKSIIELLGNGIKAMSGAVTGFMQSSLKGALDYLKALPKQALQWGKDLIAGFINGLTSSVGGLLKSASQIAGSITNTICGVLGIHSPSTVFEEIGSYIMDGLEIGLKNGSGDVMKTVDDIAAELESRLSYVMDTLGSQQDVIQLRYDVWENAFAGVSDETDVLTKKLESLAAQQEIQKTRVDAAKMAYDQMVNAYGATSAEAVEYEKTLLQEVSAYQDLQNEIDDTTAAINSNSTAIDRLKTLQSLSEQEFEVWSGKMEESATEAELLAGQLASLTEQNEYQTQVVQLAQEAYQAMCEQYGENSEEALAYKETLLQEILTQQNLQNEINTTTTALNNAKNAQMQFQAAAQNALTATNNFGGAITSLGSATSQFGDMIGNQTVSDIGSYISRIGNSITTTISMINAVVNLINTLQALGTALQTLSTASSVISGLGSILGIGGAAAGGAAAAGTAAAGAGAAAAGGGILAALGTALPVVGGIALAGLGIYGISKLISNSQKSQSDSSSKASSRSVTVVQNINTTSSNAASMMREARYQQERAVLMGV